MITLDGNTYSISGTRYSHPRHKIASERVTLTGAIDRLESGFFQHPYKMTLDCSLADIGNLKTSFAKNTPSTNLLNFVDEEGFNWNPNAGVDDGTHKYSSGVFFSHMSEPRPVVSGTGWSSYNRYLVDIELTVNSSVMA